MSDRLRTRDLRALRLLAALGLCASGASHASAQEPSEPGPAPDETQVPTEAAATVDAAATPDVPTEIAELKAQVQALKEAQEEAETAALLLTDDGASTEIAVDPLRIYGFMDFGLDKWFKPLVIGPLRPTSALTFVFGNLNVYLDANPVENVRTMVELRLTLAPHGEETQLGPPVGTSYERIDTTAFDFASPSSQSQLRLGGLYIERAWAEYKVADWLKVQWGLFLTPFGIWNLDHGSPTLISLRLPTFVASQMIPTRLLGVHAYGSIFIDPSLEFGYAFHVSNGRTPIDFDFTDDKALGARVFLANEGRFGRLVLGASGYFGTYVDTEKVYNPAAGGTTWEETIHYSEQVAGIDVALDVGDFRLRSEGVMRWIRYKDGLHEPFFDITDGSVLNLPSRIEYEAYILAAYRTPWRIEPYLEADVSSKSYILPRWAGDVRGISADTAAIVLGGGVNVELTTHTLFKTQVAWVYSYDRHFTGDAFVLPMIFARMVQSF